MVASVVEVVITKVGKVGNVYKTTFFHRIHLTAHHTDTYVHKILQESKSLLKTVPQYLSISPSSYTTTTVVTSSAIMQIQTKEEAFDNVAHLFSAFVCVVISTGWVRV